MVLIMSFATVSVAKSSENRRLIRRVQRTIAFRATAIRIKRFSHDLSKSGIPFPGAAERHVVLLNYGKVASG